MSSWRRRGKVLTSDGRHAELLVLLLADVAGAVVHGDADPALVGAVGPAAVPQAADPDQDAALLHFGGDGVVVLEGVGGFVAEVAAGDERGWRRSPR